MSELNKALPQNPFGVTVQYDLSHAMVEGKIRDKLIGLGWTPPNGQPAQEDIYAFQCQAQVIELEEALHQISLCSKNSMSSKEECGHIARTAIEKLGSVSRQDPVAWLSDSPTKGNGKRLYFTKEQAWRWSSNITPLYVAPQAPEQPKREWIELTDDEIEQVGIDYVEGRYILPFGFARAIEAKLKEKNT